MRLILISFLFFTAQQTEAKECKKYSKDDKCDSKLITCYSNGDPFEYDFENHVVTKNSSEYDDHVTSIMILQGIDQTIDSPLIQDMVEAYRDTYDDSVFLNYIQCDYSKLVDKDCGEESIANTAYIGKCAAEIFTNIRIAGFYITAYDIGSYIAVHFANDFNHKIFKITMLDPLGSTYIKKPDEKLLGRNSIKKSKYKFRDCYHTNGNSKNFRCGTVDAYFNFGDEIQPGCLSDPKNKEKCSHERVLSYYTESIKSRDVFYGIKCNNLYSNGTKDCPVEAPFPIVGEHVNIKKTTGEFFVPTNSNPPFSKGKPDSKST